MEKTLVILKPDAFAKRKVGATLERFENAGFEILGAKMMRLTPALLKDHYSHIADKPFFPEIEQFMGSRPVLVVALGGQGVIDRVRLLVGPTNSRIAPAGTIRGDFGTDMMLNIVHASDSPEAAEAEIKRFFVDGEVFSI
ncbi:MAG: nucleoside-diphosphate kinase [Opitutales bacterium]|nr:nucleoside-diphosphate kinase [Opitutales bacterium]